MPVSTPASPMMWRTGSCLLMTAVLMLPVPGSTASRDAGELVASVCQACHASDGNSVVPAFPKLAGQQVTYLEKQLADWRSGKRHIEAMEPFLPQVRAADVEELARYFAAQAPAPGSVQDAALAKSGQGIYFDGNEDSGVPSCEACHQWEGQGNERYPRVAGQHQDYTIKALLDIKSRARDAGIMNRIAERMTEDEIRAVAEYIAGLPDLAEDSP